MSVVVVRPLLHEVGTSVSGCLLEQQCNEKMDNGDSLLRPCAFLAVTLDALRHRVCGPTPTVDAVCVMNDSCVKI
ncbi:hypothetical protein HPP92_029073, partial [Vanilla planifolia]